MLRPMTALLRSNSSDFHQEQGVLPGGYPGGHEQPGLDGLPPHSLRLPPNCSPTIRELSAILGQSTYSKVRYSPASGPLAARRSGRAGQVPWFAVSGPQRLGDVAELADMR